MQKIKEYAKWYILGLLLVSNFFIWYAVFEESRDGVLTVAFLDVGQGDAIFIETPNKNQILLDGGPNKKVLSELSRVMPFYDRSLDMVIASHGDLDHVGGLPEVLRRYAVDYFVDNGISTDSDVYDVVLSTIQDKEIEHIVVRRGMNIFLDENVSLSILFPDRDVSGIETNNTSIVAKLSYGDTSFLFTGDSSQDIERYLVSLDYSNLDTDVLKLGHHGSDTSTDEFFLGLTSPSFAVISAGKNNRYGHPHDEVIERLNRFATPFYGTYEEGTIIFESNGETISKK